MCIETFLGSARTVEPICLFIIRLQSESDVTLLDLTPVLLFESTEVECGMVYKGLSLFSWKTVSSILI